MPAELRRNPNSGATTIIAPERGKTLKVLQRSSPRDWSKSNQAIVSGKECPFCVKHKKMTPAEIKAYRKIGTNPNEPGWSVRVIPNIGAALDQTFPGELIEERQVGHHLATQGFGYHYVVVETTDHISCMADYSQQNMHDVVQMWRDMTNMITGDRNVKYVVIFQNSGPDAGASQPHCHSQIVGLPVIPPKILNELRGAEKYYSVNLACIYCQILTDEIRMNTRIVEMSENFVAWCPYTSRTPYNVTIGPREHQSYFANISTHHSENRLAEFAQLLQNVLKRLKVTLNDVDYNLFFHTAPSNNPLMPYYHWHCMIEPVTTAVMAGFEKGYEIFLNPRSPEDAAEDLRSAVIS